MKVDSAYDVICLPHTWLEMWWRSKRGRLKQQWTGNDLRYTAQSVANRYETRGCRVADHDGTVPLTFQIFDESTTSDHLILPCVRVCAQLIYFSAVLSDPMERSSTHRRADITRAEVRCQRVYSVGCGPSADQSGSTTLVRN